MSDDQGNVSGPAHDVQPHNETGKPIDTSRPDWWPEEGVTRISPVLGPDEAQMFVPGKDGVHRPAKAANPEPTTQQVDAWNLYSIVGLRGYARRRGYQIRKLRGYDRFALVDMVTGEMTVARNHGATVAECYFTRSELRYFLKDEPLGGRHAEG